MQVGLEALPELDHPVPASVHEIITRRDPIVTSDVAHTPAFELSFLTDIAGRPRPRQGDARQRRPRPAAHAARGRDRQPVLQRPRLPRAADRHRAAPSPARRFVSRAARSQRPDPEPVRPDRASPPTPTSRRTFATYAALKAGAPDYDAVLYDWAGQRRVGHRPLAPRRRMRPASARVPRSRCGTSHVIAAAGRPVLPRRHRRPGRHRPGRGRVSVTIDRTAQNRRSGSVRIPWSLQAGVRPRRRPPRPHARRLRPGQPRACATPTGRPS